MLGFSVTQNTIFINCKHKVELICFAWIWAQNDLCSTASHPNMVVRDTLKFLDTLQERRIFPKRVVFLSVLQRSRLNRPNQVSLRTFNHRVKRLNCALSRALLGRPGVCLFQQRRISHPIFYGCHLTTDGMR